MIVVKHDHKYLRAGAIEIRTALELREDVIYRDAPLLKYISDS